MAGDIALINKRNELPDDCLGYTIYDGDRGSALGNKHFMIRDTPEERARVCDSFEHDLPTNHRAQAAIQNIAARLVAGENIALACWCVPKRCHLECVVARVKLLVKACRK